ncbi:MAG TPA: YpmS family protein [Pseudoneobacillus sp.]|nr:YpmS family protein [Pseudoneobacillus sp.]
MQKKNWKKLFFLLLFINIGILIVATLIISRPVKDNRIVVDDSSLQGYVPFLIETKKENLTEVINHYIKKEAEGSPVNYQVVLGDEVELYGTIPIFTNEIQMKMTFKPKALDNGDLVLQQKSIAIGEMKLPVTYILKFIQDRYRLPKGVMIQPSKKIVYISMPKLNLKSDFQIRVNKFDLKENDLSFQLYVPTK